MQNHSIISDFTDGRLYKDLYESLPAEDERSFITTNFNSDGVPLFESSKCSIWPIQLIVNELPFHVRFAQPITCGI